MRTAIWVLILVTASLVAAGSGRAGASACSVPLFAYRAGTMTFSEGGRVTRVRVQIADTPDRQEIGLSHRQSALAEDLGL